MSIDWLAGRGSPLHGDQVVPGDKSMSHRALMLAAIADGVSDISGFLEGEDTLATARILGQLGVRIETPGVARRRVHGVGMQGLGAPAGPLDCGNAGTAMRLLAGLLSRQTFDSCLVGDASLSARPMARVVEPLMAMGARIDAPGGVPPLRIHANKSLQAIDYTADVPSAQVKSAILLAGLFAQGETVVREPQPTRDYTERMLAAFGWPVGFRPGEARLPGGHRLRATRLAIPGDFSSAAFLLVAASVVPGSVLRLRQVGMNPRRTGLLRALRLMGADIVEENAAGQGGEAVADLCVRHAPLHGIELPAALVPDMIDEFPVLFVAAALATGRTRIEGIGELRVKESDRLAVMSRALTAMGGDMVESASGVVIEGGRPLHGAVLPSHGDHRVAMSLAVAAQRATGELRILDCGNVATSFPGFLELATGCGFGLRQA